MTSAAEPLDVMWLGHGAERTGPPVYLLRLLEALRCHDEIRPSVVLLEGGPLLPAFEALAPTTVVGSRHLATGRRAAAAGLSRVGARRSAEALVRRPVVGHREPDVVVVNTAGSIRALDVLGRSPRRLVTHVHELATGLEYWLAPEWRRRALHDCDEVWVVADAVARDLVERHGVDAERIRTHRGVLPVGALRDLDLAERASRRAALGVGPGDVLIGASGTLDWRKAPDLFLEMAARASNRSASCLHFAWIGGDPRTPWGRLLIDQAERAGLADRIHLVDESDRPDRWFGALDVFALTSREDAFPLVCLEAAAAGVPIVTFASGGTPELLAGGGGVVVDYPDVEGFSAALASLADEPDRRRAEGQEARSAAALHTVERAVPRLVADLRRLAGR